MKSNLPPDEQAQLVADMDKARRIQNLINDPFFLSAVEAFREQIAEDFSNMDSIDLAGLQRLKIKQDVLEEFLKFFDRHIQTGQFSQRKLEESKE